MSRSDFAVQDIGPRKIPVRYYHTTGDGRRVPVVSVTQVVDLCGYGTDYSRIPTAVLANKAGIGSSVHRIAAGDAGVADYIAVDDRLIEGYKRVVKVTRAEVLWSERRVIGLRHAGTLDQGWMVADRRVLVDFKSRPLNACADPVQLGGYHCLGPEFDEHWVVELNTTKRGYKVHVFDPTEGDRKSVV